MKLTKQARSKIPASKFAGPGRSFPVEDKAHARAALMDVGKSHISPAAKARVKTVAKGILGNVK